MALGTLIGRGFVRISADTDPAKVALTAFGAIGKQALQVSMLPAIAPVVTAVGGIATAFIGAGLAAGAFGAAVKPQFSAIKDAAAQATTAQKAQEKATVAQQQAHALATKGGVAYENALAKAAAAHTRAQQLSITGSKGYKQAQKEAQQATLQAQKLAGGGGTAYAAALAKAKSASAAAKTAQDMYNESLKEMPPATRTVAVAFSGLQTKFKDWSDSLTPKTMPLFTQGISMIESILPKLTPLVTSAAASIGMFMTNIGEGVTGKVFTSFGHHISALSGGALTDFLTIAKNVVTGIVGILDSFTPMASKMTGGLASLTGRFAAWGASVGSNSHVAKFFETAKKDAPIVIGYFSQLATAATHVAGGLASTTGIGLKVAEVLASILSALPVPVLNQVVNAIVAVNLAMKAYALVTGIAGMATWAFGTANGASRAAMLATRIQLGFLWVQMRVLSVWTAITSTAFWGLAAAMLANPMTWIVIAIVAVVAAIVLIATKTTWFQTAWRVAWGAIREAALATWHFLDNNVIHPIADAFVWLWQKGIQPSLRFIVNGFLSMASTIIHGAADMFGWVPGIGGKLRSAAKAFDQFKDSVNKALGGVNNRSVSVGVVFSPGQGHGRATFAGGGPVDGPGTETSDSIDARLSKNEHVWTAKEVRGAGGHSVVAGMRRRAAQGFARGGPVGLDVVPAAPSSALVQAGVRSAVKELALANSQALYRAFGGGSGLAWARTQVGKPYQWGGDGNPSWDCSGFMSAIESVMRGQSPHRRWATGAFSGTTAPPGWVLGARAPFMIGITNAGVGHTAGTLDGTNVEMSTVGARVGGGARGYNDPLFGSHYGLVSYDRGGWLMPGRTVAYNGTGRPERVLGPHDRATSVSITLQVNAPIGSPRELENWLVAALQDAKVKGRLRGLVGP